MAEGDPLDPVKYQQIVNLLKEIRRGYEELGQANPFNGINAEELIKSVGDADKAIIKLVDGVDKMDQSLDSVGKNAKGYFQTLIGINGELKKSNEPLNITKKTTQQLQNIGEQLKNDQEGITRLNLKQLNQLKEKYESQVSSLKLANSQYILENNARKGEKELRELSGAALAQRLKSLVLQKKITQAHADTIAEYKAEVNVLKDMESSIERRITKETKVADLTSLTNNALEAAGGILKKVGLGKYADKFGEITKDAEALTEELYDQQQSARAFNEELEEAQKNGKRLDENTKEVLDDADIKAKVIGSTLKKGGAAFKKEMLVALDAKLLSGLKKGVKTFRDSREGLVKTFGLGRNDSYEIAENMRQLAMNSGESAFNTGDAIKGIQEFNSLIGGSIKLTGDELKMFSLLSNELGLTNEQAASFTKTAKLRGINAEEYIEQTKGQLEILQAQEGTGVNLQSTFASIGDYSAAAKLSMAGQGKNLANAAFQAAKLGMNQASLAKTSDSLLDFESSIAAEMEAELMTGKQLNLEDARRAALMGDQEGLAKAIGREIGTAAEFGEYNVLQQQALAKAFGMSKEELADVLTTQELLGGKFENMVDATKEFNKLKKDGLSDEDIAKQLGSKKLADQLKAESSTKRMNDVMEKLTDHLIPVMETFEKILDSIADGITYLSQFDGLLTGIAKAIGIIAGIRMFSRIGFAVKSFGKILGLFKNMSKILPKLKSMIPTALGGGGGSASKVVADVGSKAAEGGGKSLAKSAAEGASKSGSKALASGGGGGIFKTLKGLVKNLNPGKMLGSLVKKSGPKLLKTIFGKVPVLGAVLEGIFASSDIKSMVSEGGKEKEVQQAVGKRGLQALGSVGGSALGAVVGSFAGPVGTFLGAMGGEMAGRYLSGALADNMDLTSIGKSLMPDGFEGDTAEDFISRPGQPIQKFRADDIVMAGTNLDGLDGKAPSDVTQSPVSNIVNTPSELSSGSSLINTIASAITAPIDGIMSVVSNILGDESLKSNNKTPLEGAAGVDGIQGIQGVTGAEGAQGIQGATSGLLEGIQGGNFIDTIANAISLPMRGIMDIVGGMFGDEDLGDVLKNPLEGIMGGVSGVFDGNNIVDMISNAINTKPEEIKSKEIVSINPIISNPNPTTQVTQVQASPPTGEKKESNTEMVALLKELIVTVKQGGDVYIDGAKAGRSMALATSRIG